MKALHHEIGQTPQRYARLNRDRLAFLLGLGGVDQLASWQDQALAAALTAGEQVRQPEWTESIAVGDCEFVEGAQTELGVAARHRSIVAGAGGGYLLRESPFLFMQYPG